MIRVGVDVGGTKIEAAALCPDGEFRSRVRKPTPRDYDACIRLIVELVAEAEQQAGASDCPVGLGIPGSLSPADGRVRNANSTWLNGRALQADVEAALARTVRIANDANCFALSEAVDGAAAGASVVFGVIIGTGCGAGVVIDGQVRGGRNGIAGEFGHSPLPWPRPDEHQGRRCWCGQMDCNETWISGSALEDDYRRATGDALEGSAIVRAAKAGDAQAVDCLARYIDRLGRALTGVCNLLDPDVIVLGGGMSNVEALYDRLPAVIAAHAFTDVFETPVVRARFGDSSGVRGAAWLWPYAP